MISKCVYMETHVRVISADMYLSTIPSPSSVLKDARRAEISCVQASSASRHEISRPSRLNVTCLVAKIHPSDLARRTEELNFEDSPEVRMEAQRRLFGPSQRIDSSW